MECGSSPGSSSPGSAKFNPLYFGGGTQMEAAKKLGILQPTVKTRARAALVVVAHLARYHFEAALTLL